MKRYTDKLQEDKEKKQEKKEKDEEEKMAMEDTAQTIEFNIDNMDSARLSQLSDGPDDLVPDAIEEEKEEPGEEEETKEIRFEVQDHMFTIEHQDNLENYASVSPDAREKEKQIHILPYYSSKMPQFEYSPGQSM